MFEVSGNGDYYSKQFDEVIIEPLEVVSQKRTGHLSKEKLTQYEKDPYWIRLRTGLLVLYWIVVLAMSSSAVLIVILAEKCPSE